MTQCSPKDFVPFGVGMELFRFSQGYKLSWWMRQINQHMPRVQWNCIMPILALPGDHTTAPFHKGYTKNTNAVVNYSLHYNADIVFTVFDADMVFRLLLKAEWWRYQNCPLWFQNLLLTECHARCGALYTGPWKPVCFMFFGLSFGLLV